MPAGTVTQMPDASRLMSGLAACRRCVHARAGSAPGRASGPRGSVLAGAGSGRLLAWSTDSCIFASQNQRRSSCNRSIVCRYLYLQKIGTATYQYSQQGILAGRDGYPCQAAELISNESGCLNVGLAQVRAQSGAMLFSSKRCPPARTYIVLRRNKSKSYRPLASPGCTYAGSCAACACTQS